MSAHPFTATHLLGGVRHITQVPGDTCERRLAGANFAENYPLLNPGMLRAVSGLKRASWAACAGVAGAPGGSFQQRG